MVKTVEVIFLGTSGGMPTKERWLPSIYVRDWNGFNVILDIGEGAQYKMLRYGISPSKVDLIAITHSHGDHINGLPGLLQTLFMQKRRRPLTIVCDRSSSLFIREALEVEKIPFNFPLKIIEVTSSGVVNLYSQGGDILSLSWKPSCHSIESYMFKLTWKLRPRLDVEKLRRLGVDKDVSLLQKLIKEGTLRIGSKVIRLEDVSRGNGEVSLVYTGDTAPCKDIENFAKDARILIHDATFEETLADEAHLRGHSTARDAAIIARNAGVYLLILTHISARYRGSEARVLLREARKIHKNTILAWDGMRLTFTL